MNPILSQEDHHFFETEGYVVVPNAVPIALCNAVVETIFDFLGMDANNPNDWYRDPMPKGGMLEIYQTQSLWNVRQHPNLHQIFSEIYGTHKLNVTIDRVGFKTPRNPDHLEYEHKGFTHWDVDTSKLPVPFGVQGVLCLTDTEADMGGFTCAPGFHRELEAWIAMQPADRNPRVPNLSTLPDSAKVVPIPAKAGSLILWTTLLLHGNGYNVSSKPRFSQYVSMFPEGRYGEEKRQDRINSWKEQRPTVETYYSGDPREWEKHHAPIAELTELGRKLLGHRYVVTY